MITRHSQYRIGGTDISWIISHVRLLLKHVPNILVTLGKEGVLYANRAKGMAAHYPPVPTNVPPTEVISVSGAGDWLVISIIVHNYYFQLVCSGIQSSWWHYSWLSKASHNG